MTKAFITISILMLMSFSPAVPRVLAQNESALLTQPQGRIRLIRGKKSHAIQEDELLNIGDVVVVRGEGGGVIYQAYAPVKRLARDGRHKIQALSPPPGENALSLEDFVSFKRNYQLARQNRNTASPTQMGGADDNRVTLMEPRNSLVLDIQPAFVWTSVTGATRYLVNIYDSNEKVVCTADTTETRLGYPESCRQLPPGEYKWDVTAKIGDQISDNPTLYDASSFSLVSPARATAIKEALSHARMISQSDNSARSVYAAVLLEQHLYPQAELELLDALKQSPSDQSLWSLLIETYRLMKRWPAREKAKTISSDPQPTVKMIMTLDRG